MLSGRQDEMDREETDAVIPPDGSYLEGRFTPRGLAGCYHPPGGVVLGKRRSRTGLNGGFGIGRKCSMAQGQVLKSTKPHCLI